MKTVLIVVIIFLHCVCLCQYQHRVDSLTDNVKKAKTDIEKIDAISTLAEFYQVFKKYKEANDLLNEQLRIANISEDKEVLLKAFFNPSIVNIGTWTTNETFDRTIAFLNKSLNYARAENRPNYEALAYVRLAGIYRKRGFYDGADSINSMVVPLLHNIERDTVSVLYYLEQGDILLAKSEAAKASTNFAAALQITNDIENSKWRCEVYHHFAELYKSVGMTDWALDQLKKSKEENINHNNDDGLFMDYLDMARLTDDLATIQKALDIARELNSDKYLIYAKKLLFIWYTVKGHDCTKALDYLNSEPDLKQFYLNQGKGSYEVNIGNVYKYCNEPQLALSHFLSAKKELEGNFTKSMMMQVLVSIGEIYVEMKNPDTALQYYNSAFTLSKEVQDIPGQSAIAEQLSLLYAQKDSFKLAYKMHLQHMQYESELAERGAKTKLVIEKLENDKKMIEYEENRHHNLQYMFITIGIAIIFLLMLLVGMLPVNELVIKIFGYIAFVCLFEFFILLIDHKLHEWTNKQMLLIWLCKVAIIALMVPFQHFLEHKVVKYLVNHKVINGFKFPLSGIWKNKKNSSGDPKPPELNKENTERDANSSFS